jgi:hypothetical protein
VAAWLCIVVTPRRGNWREGELGGQAAIWARGDAERGTVRDGDRLYDRQAEAEALV